MHERTHMDAAVGAMAAARRRGRPLLERERIKCKGVRMTLPLEVEVSFLSGMCARCGVLPPLGHFRRQVDFGLNSGRWWEEGSVSRRRERRSSTALDVLLRWSGRERAHDASARRELLGEAVGQAAAAAGGCCWKRRE